MPCSHRSEDRRDDHDSPHESSFFLIFQRLHFIKLTERAGSVKSTSDSVILEDELACGSCAHIVPVVVVVVEVVVDSLTSLYVLLWRTSQYSPDLVGLNT